ncbi:MAG: hypothetical protein LUO79_00885 [Methanomassiliicoccales archaeon]|nr:hypothetical protein [Methanomassiliicoccales archaeon]
MTGVQNSPVSTGPSSFWEDVQRAVGFLVKGLIDILLFVTMPLVVCALFLMNIGDFGWIFDAIREVAEAIWNAFVAFLNWVWEFIIATISLALSPLISPVATEIGRYNSGIEQSFQRASDEYTEGGAISTGAYADISSSFTSGLFWVLFALSAIAYAVILGLTVITNVFAFLISMVVSLVVMLIVESVLHMTMMQPSDASKEGGSVPSLSSLIRFAVDNGGGPQNDSERSSDEGREWEVAIATMALGPGIPSVVLAAAAGVVGNELTKGAFWGMLFGAIGLVIGWGAAFAKGVASKMMGITGLFFGFMSMACSAEDLGGSQRIVATAAMILGGLALAGSLTSLIFAEM